MSDHLAAAETGHAMSHPLYQALESGNLPLAAATTAVVAAAATAIDTASWQGIAVVIASLGSMLALVIDRYYRARKESGALELDLLQRENAILREQLSDARDARTELSETLRASVGNQHTPFPGHSTTADPHRHHQPEPPQ